MNARKGFTLVELLVVIAIIAILAGIILPRVTNYISRSRAVKAKAEINGISLALTAMLGDSGRGSFAHFGPKSENAALFANNVRTLQAAEIFYQNLFYDLLRNGRSANGYEANLFVRDDVKRRLAETYMDLQRDSWGQLYRFWPGPWSAAQVASTMGSNAPTAIPFRVYKVDTEIPGGPSGDAFSLPNAEWPDGTIEPLIGYPAPRDIPVYVYSTGNDLQSAQAMYQAGATAPIQAYDPQILERYLMGGGDDVNNWDTGETWSIFY